MKFLYPFSIIIVSCVFFVKCEPMPEMTYTYVDGSNNRYLVSADTLDYQPVQSEFSSSGTYSGGEPKTVVLSEEQFRKIVEVITSAKDQPGKHIENRLMGSGTITAYEDGVQAWQFLLPMRSELKNEIEEALKATLESSE